MIPVKLNTLFKLRDIDANTSYRLAHISLLTVVRSPMLDALEGMVHISTPIKNHVVFMGDIKGMAHLMIINLNNMHLVNNYINIYICNEIHNRN